MATMTPLEKRVYDYLSRFEAEQGYSPTIRQIADGIGYRGTAAPHNLLLRLKAKGAVTWEPDKLRTLRTVKALAE